MPADRSRTSRHTTSATFGDGGISLLSDAHLLADNAFPDAPCPPSTSLTTTMSTGKISFAPNVTPGTFNDPPPPLDDEPATESLLFPQPEDDSAAPRKVVHSRKKPDNYIPRPPNAFILFRSAFIRSRHVSTGVETNHSTLSKIIGMTWQNLPNEERQHWHRKAKKAEEEHRLKYPQYAFKPLHTKGKGGKRKVREVGPKDQTRCAKIAELLVQGKKGRELDEAIKEFDKNHVPEVVTRFEAPITEHSFKQRSVSAPIPEGRDISSRQTRSLSTQPSRRSTPAGTVSSTSSPAPLHPPSPLPDMELGSPFFSDSSLDFGSFPMKQTPSFVSASFNHGYRVLTALQDFNSFPFNQNVQSSLNTFSFDPHSQPANPLPTTFPESSPRSTSLVLPQLQIDTSFVSGEAWSPTCHSPCSPSTNSMPPTPSYSGSPPLPEEAFGGSYAPHGDAADFPIHSKSMGNNLQASNFGAYQTQPIAYTSAAQYSDSNCNYGSMQLPELHHSQGHPSNIDYSSFMASLPSYSL